MAQDIVARYKMYDPSLNLCVRDSVRRESPDFGVFSTVFGHFRSRSWRSTDRAWGILGG